MLRTERGARDSHEIGSMWEETMNANAADSAKEPEYSEDTRQALAQVYRLLINLAREKRAARSELTATVHLAQELPRPA